MNNNINLYPIIEYLMTLLSKGEVKFNLVVDKDKVYKARAKTLDIIDHKDTNQIEFRLA